LRRIFFYLFSAHADKFTSALNISIISTTYGGLNTLLGY